MRKRLLDFWWMGSQFPEYPGAALTEGIHQYTSTIDPDLTDLNVRYYYPTSGTNLPLLTVIHGYEQTAVDIGEDTLRRFARYGFFVMAVEMRGSTGSGGNSGVRDASGREVWDIYDAEESCKNNFSSVIFPTRQGIVGFSGGGGNTWNIIERFPDRYTAAGILFGISDYESWYNEEPARQANLSSYIGGTPAAKPDEYDSRNARLSLDNILCWVSFCHDVDDASVDVTHSQAMETLYTTAARTDYFYSESNSGSAIRWEHGYPATYPDLIEFEQYWKDRVKQKPINTVATSGTLNIPGSLVTKRFTIHMNDGNYLQASRSRFGTVVYNVDANTYEVTNNSANYAVVSIRTTSGLVATGVLAAGETYTFSPVTIEIDSSTPIMWFDAASKKLLSGSDVTAWADKTGGPQYQGYAIRTANRPALLSTDINSLPAIEFVAASSEYLEGERRRDLQGLSSFTLISVATGAYIGHGASANLHIQQALSGGSIFDVVANGSNSFGSYGSESATYLVRSMLYDGAEATNALKLIARKNKVAQTLSFTGTIPTTTESNSASVLRLGRRVYDATYLGGKIAEFMIFNSKLADIGDKEDILKTKYAI